MKITKNVSHLWASGLVVAVASSGTAWLVYACSSDPAPPGPAADAASDTSTAVVPLVDASTDAGADVTSRDGGGDTGCTADPGAGDSGVALSLDASDDGGDPVGDAARTDH